MVTNSLFNKIFGQSPIRPLREHMDRVQSSAEELIVFFKAALAEEWSQAELSQQKIKALTEAADEMKRDLRLHLPKSLFLPVARSDLLELLSAQDKLAGTIKDIAGRILGRRMIFPDAIRADLPAYVERCVAVSRLANKTINEFHELFDSGFSGQEVKVISDMIKDLAHAENETDTEQVLIRRRLFAVEDQLPPVHVMFIYKILEWLGDIADLAQLIGDRLQILLAR